MMGRRQKNNLKEKLGKHIEMHSVPSGTLIGGFRLHFDDVLIDASLESRLRALSRRLYN
jgi:F0F1-type ATP synthase delta subunit